MKRLIFLFLLYVVVVDVLCAQNPNVAKFSAAVATDQDLFVAKNVARPSVTLTAAVDNATLALPVTDGTKFRQYQIIGVELELMQVCSTAALSLTACSRGLGGTTPAAHSTGAVIGAPFADIQINQLAAEIKAIETALGANLANVVRIAGSYTDPSWLTLTKAKVGLGNVENTALSTWTGSSNIATIGALAAYVKAPEQINFSLFDPNVAIPASTIVGIWRAEYGAATVTKVSCMADTADAVIQIKKTTSTNVLSANLTCGNGSWLNTTTFAAAAFALADDLGLQVVSGTAKRINVSIQYTQQ